MGMRIEPEISGVQVVLVGDFNPAIFTPAWFSLYRLLPESVASSAKLEVAHPQATKFTADWLHLEVTVERFVVHTLQAPHVRVRDLVVRVFREHLYHTPRGRAKRCVKGETAYLSIGDITHTSRGGDPGKGTPSHEGSYAGKQVEVQ